MSDVVAVGLAPVQPATGPLWHLHVAGVIVGDIARPDGEAAFAWRITVTIQMPCARSGKAATLEAAVADFEAAWTVYRGRIGDVGWRIHAGHEAMMAARRKMYEEERAATGHE